MFTTNLLHQVRHDTSNRLRADQPDTPTFLRWSERLVGDILGTSFPLATSLFWEPARQPGLIIGCPMMGKNDHPDFLHSGFRQLKWWCREGRTMVQNCLTKESFLSECQERMEVDVDAGEAGLDAGGLPFHKGTYFPLNPGCLITGSLLHGL